MRELTRREVLVGALSFVAFGSQASLEDPCWAPQRLEWFPGEPAILHAEYSGQPAYVATITHWSHSSCEI